ncbi:nuclear pore complex protein Nup153-like isoform X2 [Lineus longissimus]|uniref:nuclear pore complex protein Nup153-like isoform X2 n=1 Tax=Lineus longissimus TaxID=88925 RepID=UPI002B4F7CBC
MSNDGLGKIKQKRKNVPSKPYTRGKSFFGKVKDTVKEILQPSWLGSIVSSLTPARLSESAPSTPMPPQVKPDSQFSSSTPRRNAYPLNSLHRPSRGLPPPNMYSAVDGNMPFVSYVPNNSQPSTSTQGPRYDDQINISNYSFSGGLTSAVPAPAERQDESVSLDDSRLRDQPQPRETPREHEEESRVRSTPELDTSVLSQRNESSSFFGKPSKRCRTTGPQFNISLFTTPRPLSDRSMMPGSSFQQSPYYPGKTTYGGAASHRKSRLKATAPYQSNLSVNKVTPRPLNKSLGGTVTSSTARKILDALESMPSVLHDAKRIPVNNSSLYDSPLSFTPSSYPRRRSLQPNTSRLGTPAGAPPTSRVNAVGRASIAQNRQYLLPMREQPSPGTSQPDDGRISSSKSKVWQLPMVDLHPPGRSQTEEVVATSLPPVTHVETPQHGSGKMKRDKSHHYQARKDEDDEDVEVPNLPTKFVLPSDGFKLDIAVKAPQPKSSGPVPEFTFSSPIQKISTPITASPGAATGFQFSSPISIDEQGKDEKHVMNKNLMPGISFGSSSGLKLKTKPPKEVAPVSSFAPASELKQGSVLDILGKGSVFSSANKSSAANDTKTPSSVTNVNSFLDKLKPAAGSWECPICMISNKPDVSKCVACMANKPSDRKESFKSLLDEDIMAKLKPPEGSWSCPTCMVSNKSDADSCVCCSTAKPKLKHSGSSGSSVAIKTDQTLYENLKRPAGNWECPVCMISNKADASSCLACSSPNPTKSNHAPTKESQNALAKLKRPEDAWTCDTCLVSNGPTALKCMACETPKPGATKPSGFAQPGGFQFGGNSGSGFVIGNKTSSSALFAFGGSSKNDADSTPKTSDSAGGGFKFGAVDSSSTAGFKISSSVSGSSGAFKFGGENSEKKNSTPSAGFTFGAKTSGAKSDSKPDFVTGGFKFGADSNKDSGIKIGQQASDSKDTLKPVGGFAFNAGNSDSSKTSALGGVLSNSNKSDPASLGGGSKTTNTSSAAGGFSFGGSTKRKADDDDNSEVKKVPEFQFGAPVTAVPSLSQHKQDTAEPKKENGSIGGFAFQPIATATSKPSTAGFGVGGLDSKAFALEASQASVGKPVQSLFRSSENEPAVKRKPADGLTGGSATSGFNFGSQGSTPTFGQSNSSSSTPTFGQSATNPTTSAAFNLGGSANPLPVASSTATFNFGAPVSTSATPGFGFGQSASSANPTATPALTGGFNFSQSTTKPSTTASFSFGQTATTQATTSAAPGGFAFGQSTSGAAQSASTTSTFTFGATATTKAPSFGGFNAAPAQQAAAPAFGAATAPSFGQQQSSAPMPFGTPNTAVTFGGQSTGTSFSQATPAFGATAPGPTPAFGSAATALPTFGATATKTLTAAPAFGAGSTGFGVQATPAPAFGAPATTANSSGFNFSQSAQTGAFNFAAQQQQATSAPFQFGANKPTQPTPVASQPTATSGFNFTPNMSFGGPAAPATPQPFQFGAAPAPSTDGNPFSVSVTPNIAGRKIKRATRKLKGR